MINHRAHDLEILPGSSAHGLTVPEGVSKIRFYGLSKRCTLALFKMDGGYHQIARTVIADGSPESRAVKAYYLCLDAVESYKQGFPTDDYEKMNELLDDLEDIVADIRMAAKTDATPEAVLEIIVERIESLVGQYDDEVTE